MNIGLAFHISSEFRNSIPHIINNFGRVFCTIISSKLELVFHTFKIYGADIIIKDSLKIKTNASKSVLMFLSQETKTKRKNLTLHLRNKIAT